MFEGCFCAISATMCPLCEHGFSGKRGAKPVVCCVEGAKNCHDPGSNRGPLDLQSNALPTELSWRVMSTDTNLEMLKVWSHEDS